LFGRIEGGALPVCLRRQAGDRVGKEASTAASHGSHLKEVNRLLMTMAAISTSDAVKVQRIFEAFDKNGDGGLSKVLSAYI
jgi:hypothetical protein